MILFMLFQSLVAFFVHWTVSSMIIVIFGGKTVHLDIFYRVVRHFEQCNILKVLCLMQTMVPVSFPFHQFSLFIWNFVVQRVVEALAWVSYSYTLRCSLFMIYWKLCIWQLVDVGICFIFLLSGFVRSSCFYGQYVLYPHCIADSFRN